ncbi:MAG TPA: dihydrofolate reductase family protein [Candidatus Limnocylindria bacterium]|nr:dihydrofolate reductase family protein [Candidatus Limnocylindria bacterium]
MAVAEAPRAAALPRLDVTWAAAGALAPVTDSLTDAYGGTPRFPEPRSDRPAVIANFVSTLDGVVSYATPEAAGGGEVSGFFGPDRFVMGLLRAHADAVLVGAGTVRAAPSERWTPADVYPHGADAFATIRRARSLPPQPTTVVMTASGGLDPMHPGLCSPDTPVLLAHTSTNEPMGFAANVENLRVTGATDLLRTLCARGVRLLLCEGGPHLLAQLLRLGAVDELFLTVAPQIAGRTAEQPRLALAEGEAFNVADAPWWRLQSLHRVGSHLFLRYAHEGPKGE